MKKIRFSTITHFVLVWLVVLSLFVVGCTRKEAERPLKIGADITLTGQIAYWGQQVQKGLDVAVKNANKIKNAKPIVVVYQDNQGNAKNAISIFQRFSTVDKVSTVISIFTPISKPLRANAAQNKISLLATVVSAVGFGLENEWSFRDFPSQEQQAVAIAQYAYNHMGLRKAVSLVVNDDYGRDGEKVFTREFKRLGGKVIGNDTVDQKTSDVRAQATKLIGLNPDSLFIIVRDTTLGISAKQFRELGFKGQIIGVNAFDAPVVWKAAGSAGDGVVFTSAFIDFTGNPEAASFAEQYKKMHNEDPDWVAVYGYTIGIYLSELLRKANGDPSKLRMELAKLDTDSIRGRLKMNSERDVVSPIGVYERKDNSNVILKKLEL